MKYQRKVKNACLIIQQAKVRSSVVLFCSANGPKPKYIQFIFAQEDGNQQIFHIRKVGFRLV